MLILIVLEREERERERESSPGIPFQENRYDFYGSADAHFFRRGPVLCDFGVYTAFSERYSELQ